MSDRQTLYVKTLRRAADALGSREALASILVLDAGIVASMLEGSTRVPEWVFLACVDVVLSAERALPSVPPSGPLQPGWSANDPDIGKEEDKPR